MEIIRMGINKNFILPTVVIALTTTSVFAQSNEQPGLFANADIIIARDDNIYRVTDQLKESDNYFRLSPELIAVGGLGKHRFQLSYTGDYAKYSDNSNADFNDHNLQVNVDLAHTTRFSSRFEIGYQKEHDDPGAINLVQLDIDEYNKYNRLLLLAGLAYGSEKSIGRFEVDYRRTDKDYTTNNLDYWDYVADQLSGRFIYRVAPNTRIYVELITSDYDYSPSLTFELDNTFNNYRAGVTWNYSEKLTGDINLGYQTRNYDQENIQNISGLAFDGEISWAINTYSKLAISASREAIDSSLEEAGGFIRTSYGLRLSHEATERLKLVGAASYSDDELLFRNAREDRRYIYQLGLEYELLRNIALSAKYTLEERDSTLLIANYRANIISFNIIASLED